MGKSGRKLLLLRQKRKKVLNWRKEKQPLSRKQKLSSKQKLLLLQPRRKLPLLKLPPPKLPPTKPPLQKLPPPKLPQRKSPRSVKTEEVIVRDNGTVVKNKSSTQQKGVKFEGHLFLIDEFIQLMVFRNHLFWNLIFPFGDFFIDCTTSYKLGYKTTILRYKLKLHHFCSHFDLSLKSWHEILSFKMLSLAVSNFKIRFGSFQK